MTTCNGEVSLNLAVPELPTELVNEILCIAALKSNRFERACLLSLSKNIYSVVSSIVYRVLAPKESETAYDGRSHTSVQDFYTFVAWVESKPSSFLSQTVKALHLNLWNPGPRFKADDWTRFFNILNGLHYVHLYCYYLSDDSDVEEAKRCALAAWNAVFRLPKLRTVFFPWTMRDTEMPSVNELEPPLLALSSITHLILDCADVPAEVLSSFAGLTHLAVVYPWGEYSFELDDIFQYQRALQSRLQVLIVCLDGSQDQPLAMWSSREEGDSKIVTFIVEEKSDGKEFPGFQGWLRNNIFAEVDEEFTIWRKAEWWLALRQGVDILVREPG
ncbi:hypothetical protein DL96DRAFT_520871 [Flagelloscypha sp. PMI_526]|nr:hypothetical protein DL96DRAFT_520871 [Flagelloscypha sp. PMI_526]